MQDLKILEKDYTIDVVIPLYNSEKSLNELIQRIQLVTKEYLLRAKLILIDDGNTDKTWQILKNYKRVEGIEILAIKLSRNFGQHSAIMAGMKYSTANYVVVMDDDLQDRPEDIPKLIKKALLDNYDIVIGVDSNRDKFIHRLNPSSIFHLLRKKPAGTTSFKIISSEVRKTLLEYNEAYELSGPVIDTLGFRKTYLEISREKRSKKSGYSFNKRIFLTLNIFVSKSRQLSLFYIFLSLLVAIFSIIYSLILTFQLLIYQNGLPAGLNQIALLVSTLLTISSLGFGVLIMLNQKILRYAMETPKYHVAELLQIPSR